MANPSKNYLAYWKCNSTANFDPVDSIEGSDQRRNGQYEVQLGRLVARFPSDLVTLLPGPFVQSPLNTLSSRTFTIIPSEQQWRAIPPVADVRDRHFAFGVPWTRDYNFERSSSAGEWAGADSTSTLYCCNSDAAHGSGYIHIRPTSHHNRSFLLQTFFIRGQGLEGGQAELGTRTGINFEASMRCPTWAPGHAARMFPNVARIMDRCRVVVWIKTPAEPSWARAAAPFLYFATSVPNDGEWHHVEVLDEFPTMQSDAVVQLSINSSGYPMDFDNIWVWSGR